MIAIACSISRERAAFAALCEVHGWAYTECESIRALKKLLRHTRPRVVLTRYQLSDGYSDDIIALLNNGDATGATKIVVLLGAGAPSSLEVRQVALGADCVQRDPVRTDVLVQYLMKYHGTSQRSETMPSHPSPKSFHFAGATVDPIERTLQRGSKTAKITPRELELIELLAHSADEVVTYETLYSEILGRKFKGETSNLRVLLGKLDASARRAGVMLRRRVEVIPKLGYRYRNPLLKSPGTSKSHRSLLSAAC